MLEMSGDGFLFGGYSDEDYDYDEDYLGDVSAWQSSIYQLSCSSGLCSWTELSQQLEVERRGHVAIPLQDNFCN